MKKNVGEYNEGLKKLFGSFKKRFGLSYSETLEYVDSIIEDKNYAVLYFASDITSSKELIEEINETGVGQAFGFYKSGPMAFNSVDEIKEAVPRIVGDGGNKFIFVELEERSRFRLEDIPMSIFVKQGRSYGEMVVDVVKSREYVQDEVIRRIEKDDCSEFNALYHNLYLKRWEQRNDIFIRSHRMTNNTLSTICNKHVDLGVFVCYKEDRLAGFILYESFRESDNRKYTDNYSLVVNDIYVVEEFRRQGIATRLFREVARVAEKNHLKCVRFRTWGFDKETSAFVQSLNKTQLYEMHEVNL